MSNTENTNGVLSVVMPAYNEENSIIKIIQTVLARPEVGELIVVNDASTDSTWEKLQFGAQGSVSAEVLLALKRVPFHSIKAFT